MKRKLSLMILIAVVAIFTAACGSSSQSSTGDSEKKKGKEVITVKHQLGETEVEKNPEKVVVFDFGALDTLDKLGVEVTGVPKQNLPAYLDKYKDDKYKNAGGLMEPDFEAIKEMEPNLIIISGRQQDSYDQFAEIAPTIYLGVDTKKYLESFKSNVNIIAEIFGKKTEASKELTAIENSINSLKEHVSETESKALITLVTGGKISAYGPGSRFGIIHDVLGVKPVTEELDAAAVHGTKISVEFIVEKNPDILYVVDRDAVVSQGENGASAKEVIENDLVKKTNAYKNGQIYYLNPNYWYLSGGGLISVAEMVKEVQEGIK
ncbi:siderophore ABC transporter substrate-binding protein [Bacillus massilinigeriensis]|uniref:siderophore ABC transporter substrate-binding protein n=1 Tax=Bacillus massilionigeriensis TaxID=1805475 RepID=UPI00096B15A3|nr:siderophore ABC transporter substrate-binding protein [Bacillus massilionigeriensis]